MTPGDASEQSGMLRIYSDRSHYSRAERPMLADVLRPFWKDHPVSPEELQRTYGDHLHHYRMVDSPEDADLCVLPLAWNHYYRHRSLEAAIAFIELARAAGRPVATWVAGDSGVRVPLDDVFVFRQSGYASRRRQRQFGLPVFIRDPLPVDRATSYTRPKSRRPLIGFCGQAADRAVVQWAKAGRAIIRNLSFQLGVTAEEPESIFPPTRLRTRALRLLEESRLVETRFLKRARSDGGARTFEELQRRRTEFWGNVSNTEYTVCVRGTGNFSQRLYEVLAMGRIPVFINTDCVLPSEHLVDWKQYCVWLEASELATLPQRVAEHHAQLDDASFIELQRACRRLWADHLSYPGFFRHFPSVFLPGWET
jgi:hypothetical protein